MARASTNDKNRALLAIADEISNSRDALRAANAEDMARGAENGLDAALLDRLELTDARIDTMIEGLHQVAALPDPVGEITDMKYRRAVFRLVNARSAGRYRYHLRKPSERDH